MTQDLDDLLLEWEERRERGETVCAADLCPGPPGLRAELARLIGLLEQCKWLFEVSPPPAAADDPPVQFAGYEVRGVLGRGGAGVVYRGWDAALRREVALKMLEAGGPAGLPGGRAARRFLLEAQILAQLKHEHIVPVYGSGLHGGRAYFAMECVAGGSLAQRLPEFTAAGPCVVAPFLARVAAAVHFAHARGVLHRDLKPANILLTGGPELPAVTPLVSDFGLAKLLDAGAGPETVMADETPPEGFPALPADASRLTAPGQQPGTPAYMAPEQFDPVLGPVGPAADVWALGVILYEMLTGRKPFTGATREELCRRVRGAQPAVDPRVDRGLRAVVARCLEKDPARRYPSAEALRRDLARWRPRRRARRALVALAATAALFGGTSLWAWNSPGLRQRARGEVLAWEFRRRGQVDLIAALHDAPPAAAVRNGAAGTSMGRSADGLRIDSADTCCLVRLMPRIPAGKYRISAVLRLERPLVRYGLCGVYFNHAEFTTSRGRQHYFHSAHFLDERDLTPGHAPGAAAFAPFFAARLCSATHDPVTGLTRDWLFPMLHESESVRYTRGPEGIDRAVEVVVDGANQSARVSMPGGAPPKPLGRLGPGEWADIREALAADYRDLAEVPPGQRHGGSGVGVFVSRAVCLVKEFRVERLSD